MPAAARGRRPGRSTAGDHLEAHRGPGPVPRDEQDAPPPPQRRLQTSPYLGCRLLGRAQQDELAAVEQRCRHLRPGRAGIRNQQDPPGIKAEADSSHHPRLGHSGDSAPRPGRRRRGRQGQAQQPELGDRHHRPADQAAAGKQLTQRWQYRQSLRVAGARRLRPPFGYFDRH